MLWALLAWIDTASFCHFMQRFTLGLGVEQVISVIHFKILNTPSLSYSTVVKVYMLNLGSNITILFEPPKLSPLSWTDTSELK